MTDLADSITNAAVNLTNKSVNSNRNGKEEQQQQQSQRILRSNSSSVGGGGGGGGGVNGNSNSLEGGGGGGLADNANRVVGCKAVLVEEKNNSKSNKDKKNITNANTLNQQPLKANSNRILRGGGGGGTVGIQQTQLLEYKVRRMEICNANSENDNDTENLNNKSNNNLNSNTDFEHPPSKKLLTSYNNSSSPPSHLQQNHTQVNRMNVDSVTMVESDSSSQQQDKTGDNDDSMNVGSNNSNMQMGTNGDAVIDASDDGED